MHAAYFHLHDGQGHDVKIDLFFGAFDGQYFILPLWLHGLEACIFPNSGFSYANYSGMPMLAVVDQHAYHAANYGPDYLLPREASNYTICVTAGSSIEFDRIRLRGPLTSFLLMCSAHTTQCPSPQAREVLLKRMFAFVDSIAQAHSLQYVVACASRTYMDDAHHLPMYGAVAVPASQEASWIAKLSKHAQTTTYRIERANASGAIVHVRYSHYSPVLISVWRAPSTVFAHAGRAAYGQPAESPISVSVSRDAVSVSGLCDACRECEGTRRDPWQRGVLMNINTRTCLTRSDGEQAVLRECTVG